MYSYLVRAAARVGRGTVQRAAVPAPSSGRSLSATSAAGAPVPGTQSAAMEQPKQPKQQDAVHGETNTGDGAHKDPITHSFGEGYTTRADEDGFGTVYAKDDDEDGPGHPGYDTSQGSEVREKEKGRHLKDDKHAT